MEYVQKCTVSEISQSRRMGVVDGRHVRASQLALLGVNGAPVAEPLRDLRTHTPIAVSVIPDVKSV